MPKETDVKAWIVAYIAEFCDLPLDTVGAETPFSHFGVDSADAILIGGALEEAFDIEIDASIFLRNENIADLMADLRANGVVEA